MTNLEDALVAVDAGADAVGFVFYAKSPRCVTAETAREICQKLPESVEKVGVFVGPETDPGHTLLETGLTGIQSYISAKGMAGGRGSTKATGRGLAPDNYRFMFAFPISLFDDPLGQIGPMVEGLARSRQKIPEGHIPDGVLDALVLDSGNAQAPGGTGKRFDWESASPIAEVFRRSGVKLVVAGGLTPENVENAIRILKPWGVDVSSGVEAAPGKKDAEKVRAFVRAVRECDRRAG